MASKSVLVVGCGMTGAVTAFLLSKLNPNRLIISCWDKARGAGGRMSSIRNRENINITADLGAQYISVTPDYQRIHKTFYEDLVSSELLRPMTENIDGNKHPEGTKHYVAPMGINSLVKHFLSLSGARTEFNRLVKNVNEINGKWQVETDDGEKKSFDCVILTPPVPQVLQFQGDISKIIESNADVQEKMKNVEYSSRYALGLFFPANTKIDVPWAAKYITDNECIRFISLDSKKRGRGGETSMVVHTSVPFGIQYIDSDSAIVQDIILKHLKEILPDLPTPIEVKCQKWRYSQVTKPYEGAPGCVILKENPILAVGGDAFSKSTLDGCLTSAQNIVDKFVTIYNNQ